MQTVPLFSGNEDFLTGGSLPQQFNEVVAVGDESLIGQELSVYLRNDTDWEANGYIKLDVTVVGVTDLGSGLYFHDDVGRTLTLNYLGSEYTYIPWYREVPSDATYTNYRDARSQVMYGPNCAPFHAVCTPVKGCTMHPMTDTEVYVSIREYGSVLEENPGADYQALYSLAYETQAGTWNIAGLHESTLSNVLAVSPTAFQKILAGSGIGDGDQVSIHIRDYAYTQRVIEALEKAGYYALSPYVLGATHIDSDLAAQRQQTLFICIGALLFILLLQLIVLRAMFAMENDSYRTLSDMGLTCQTARRSIFLQVIAFTVAGQLLGFGLIALCSALGIPQITGVTKYLFGIWWVVISLIHLASTMLSALLISSGLKKKVYKRTAGRRDLVIEEEEAAV